MSLDDMLAPPVPTSAFTSLEFTFTSQDGVLTIAPPFIVTAPWAVALRASRQTAGAFTLLTARARIVTDAWVKIDEKDRDWLCVMMTSTCDGSPAKLPELGPRLTVMVAPFAVVKL